MIYVDILDVVQDAVGTRFTDSERRKAIYMLSQRLAGCRPYMPSFPKMNGQMKLYALGTATDTMTQQQISAVTGLQVRHIRRLKNGT